jgi:hypothetical protein
MAQTVQNANEKQFIKKQALPENVLRPVPAFNHEVLLPESLRWWIYDEAARMGAPIEYVAISAIVAAGNLMGSKLSVQPKRLDNQWTVRMNFWGMAVGAPSSKKTPGLNAGQRHTKALEKIERKTFEEREIEYKAVKQRNTVKMNAAKKHLDKLIGKKLAGDMSVSEADMEFAEQAFDEAMKLADDPILRRLVINDTTVEKLGEILAENPGVMVFRDELHGWLNSLEKEDRANDKTFFLEAFNGTGDYTYDRIGRGTIYIPNNCVGVLGGIQPSRLQPMVNDAVNNGGGDGLLARFQFLVYPDPVVLNDEDREPHSDSQVKAYQAFERLHQIPVQEFNSTLVFSVGESQDTFTTWRRALEARIQTEDFGEALQSHLGKFAKLCAGLAGLFSQLDGTKDIELSHVERAIAWCEFLEQHAMRIYGLADDAAIINAKLILKRKDSIPLSGGCFKVHHIRDRKWAGLGDTNKVKDAIAVLLDYGQIAEVTQNGKAYEWID